MHKNLSLLLFIRELLFLLSSGLSLRSAISDFSDSEMSMQVKSLVCHIDRGIEIDKNLLGNGLIFESFVEVLIVGLSGYPIKKYLIQIEKKLMEQIDDELQVKLQQLPIKTLLPVLFLMLPAYLILMIGPILIQLLEVW